MDGFTLGCFALAAIIVIALISVFSLRRMRGSGGGTIFVDGYTIGVEGYELQQIIAGMTENEKFNFYAPQQSRNPSAETLQAAQEAIQTAARRWLVANPNKAAQKGYPLS